MHFKIVLIDDDDRDRAQLPPQIQRLGGDEFNVVSLPPPSDLDLRPMLEIGGDLFLVDYELDTKQENGTIAPYLGMTFAARLREKQPAYPIVLLTRSDLPIWTSAQRTVKAAGTFDDIIYKDIHFESDIQTTYSKLVALANGYGVLRNGDESTVDGLLNLLQSDSVGRDKAREALPPSDGWAEYEAAHWIRSVLLGYPGVLYDVVHAATAIGLNAESFANPAVTDLFQTARYRGPFHEERQYWWRHLLFDRAHDVCRDGRVNDGLRRGFRIAVKNLLAIELDPSLDIETDISPADTVCYVLGSPVRIETSIPYHPDGRPPVMETARVSFKAIRESNDVDEMYFDDANRSLINDIRSMAS